MRVILLADSASAGLGTTASRLGDFTAVAIAADAESAKRLFERAGAASALQWVRIWDDALLPLLQEPRSREMVQAALLAAVGRRLDSRFFVVPDSQTGWLGPALAEELDAPHVSAVVDAKLLPGRDELDPESLATMIVRRRCLHGIQRLRGLALGVLGMLPRAPLGAASPPSSALPPAGGPPIETWTLATLGLHAPELPRPLLRPLVPEQQTAPQVHTFDSLPALAERLRQDGLVPTEGGG